MKKYILSTFILFSITLLFGQFPESFEGETFPPEGWKVLRPWAIENGFDGAEIVGRKGWTKLFPEFNSDWVWLTYDLK